MEGGITYVTAFYNIYGRIPENYVENFAKLAETKHKIVLFLDPEIPANPALQYPNVTIVHDVRFSSLRVKQKPLPEIRNMEKDTFEFIALMNSKTEFMVKALRHVDTPYIAWIDFGIAKIFKQPETTLARLKHIIAPPGKVLIPGCWGPSAASEVNRVVWRFCGGLFFCDVPTLIRFDKYVAARVEAATTLTWEVNVWAEIEITHPDLFHWYKADHNDSIVNGPSAKKVMVILMIKNEEKIIRRCIERALTIADAICISDTGSTDGTLAILKEYLPSLNIPATVFCHDWRNFGHNRTLSFKAAQEFCKTLKWDPEFTHGLLLDADMKFVMTDRFDKNALSANGYRLIQKSGNLEYYNTRFVKLGHPWTCVGVTHEYWDGSATENLTTVYIDDVGDGGCKADKFPRDEKLLRQGLTDDPANVRYMFYLAQTLKDLKRIDEAIDMYKQRVAAGGWHEEIWYSMYQISRLYSEKENWVEMEYWGQKAYDFNKGRAESLYYLTRIFRERSQHFKAWHYMLLGKSIPKTTDLLFIETPVYEHLFDYERTILNYYIQPDKRADSLRDLINYYNRQGDGYSNLQFYVEPVRMRSVRPLNFPQMGDYIPSSTSILRDGDGYLLNIRYVNYRIQGGGSYLMSVDGVLSSENPVRTTNYMLHVDADFNAVGEATELRPDFPSLRTSRIQGLEDLRLYREGDETRWIATSVEYSHDGNVRQVMGRYGKHLSSPTSLKTPQQSDCEKNWIPLGNDEFIYGWHPYRIGRIVDGLITWTFTQKTPRFFEHMRGSSNVVEYDGSLYTLTHVVIYSAPRKYYHQLVRLNKETRAIEACTTPFYFLNNDIEYCLGIEIKAGGLYAIVSQRDSNPVLIEIGLDALTLLPVDNDI